MGRVKQETMRRTEGVTAERNRRLSTGPYDLTVVPGPTIASADLLDLAWPALHSRTVVRPGLLTSAGVAPVSVASPSVPS